MVIERAEKCLCNSYWRKTLLPDDQALRIYQSTGTALGALVIRDVNVYVLTFSSKFYQIDLSKSLTCFVKLKLKTNFNSGKEEKYNLKRNHN